MRPQDLWFGNFQFGSIDGFKYEDVNRDGSYVPADGDVPLAGVTMYLTGTDGMGSSVSRTATTLADGTFAFGNVKPGVYTVGESTATDTNGDGVPDDQQDMVLDGTTIGVTLTSGETESISYAWSNYVYGSIHGVKFDDLNANGALDAGEPDLEGIKFDLYRFVSTTTQKISSGSTVTTYNWEDVGDATSDSHGEFWFTQLDPGTYEVVEQDNSPWIQSTGQPTLDPNSANTNPATSTSAFEIISRREYVWELGAASRPMDTNDDGIIDAGEQQAGYNAGALKNEVLATPTDGPQDLWFGNFQNGSINGFKYEDVNRDGTFNTGDLPLAGVTMYLTGTDGMGGAVSRTATTKADGTFEFAGVKPGAYTVGESTATDTNVDGVPDVDQDMVLDGTTVDVTLTSGETENISYQWANYVYGSIHGVKFEDLNANGVWDKDAGETVLPGIKFDLYRFVSTTTQKISSGNTVTTYKWEDVGDATSDSHGEFWFTQLDPGTYEVIEQDNSPWIQSTDQPTVDPNTANTDPDSSSSAFDIISRREYVWELGAASRPMDTDGDGVISQDEHDAGYNAGR